MCCGKKIDPAQFRYKPVVDNGSNNYTFNGKNSVFANRYVEVDTDITLSFSNLKEGGKYILKATKATANEQVRITLDGAVNNGTGGDAFLIQGSEDQVYHFLITYDGTTIRMSNVNGGDDRQVFEVEVSYAANSNTVTLPLAYSDTKYITLIEDVDGIGIDRNGMTQYTDSFDIDVLGAGLTGKLKVITIKY